MRSKAGHNEASEEIARRMCCGVRQSEAREVFCGVYDNKCD
jgi:hypothetical protein